MAEQHNIGSDDDMPPVMPTSAEGAAFQPPPRATGGEGEEGKPADAPATADDGRDNGDAPAPAASGSEADAPADAAAAEDGDGKGEPAAGADEPSAGSGEEGKEEEDDEDDDMPALVASSAPSRGPAEAASGGSEGQRNKASAKGFSQLFRKALGGDSAPKKFSDLKSKEADAQDDDPPPVTGSNGSTSRTSVNRFPREGFGSRRAEPKSSRDSADGAPKNEGAVDSDEQARIMKRMAACKDRDDKAGEARCLRDLAELHYRFQRHEATVDTGSRAVTVAKDAGDKETEAEALRFVVKGYVGQDECVTAEKLAKEAQLQFQQANNRKEEAIILLALADLNLARGRPKEAEQLTTEAMRMFREDSKDPPTANDLKNVGETCRTMAAAMQAMPGKSDKAWALLERSFEKFTAAECHKQAAAVLRTHSRALLNKGDFEEAFEKAQQALEICEREGDKKGEAASCECLAAAHLTDKEGAEEALDLCTRSLNISAELLDKRGEIAGRQTRIEACLAHEDKESALTSAKDALVVAKEYGDVPVIATALETLAGIYLQLSHPQKALQMAAEEVAAAGKSGSAKREASALQKQAGILFLVGNGDEESTQEAEERFKQARDILLKAGDTKGEAQACQQLGEFYVGLKKYEDALDSFTSAADLFQELGETMYRVGVLKLITSVHMELKDHDAAKKCSEEQLEVFREAGYRDEEGGVLLGIADLLQGLQEPKEGLRYANDARDLYVELKDKEGEGHTMMMIAALQSDNRQPTEAIKATDKAAQLFKELNDVNGQVQALQTAASVYLKEEKFAEAVRVASKARDIHQERNNTKEEAAATQVIAQCHISNCEQVVALGKETKEPAQAALKAAQDAQRLFRAVGDLEGLAYSLQVQAQGYIYCDKAEHALQAAKDALEAYDQLKHGVGMSAALITMAQAYMAMDRLTDAKWATSEAGHVSQEIGDEAGLDAALKLTEILDEASQQARNADRRVGAGGRGGGGGRGRGSEPRRGPFSEGREGSGSGSGTGPFGRSAGAGRAPPGQRRPQGPDFHRQSFGLDPPAQ